MNTNEQKNTEYTSTMAVVILFVVGLTVFAGFTGAKKFSDRSETTNPVTLEEGVRASDRLYSEWQKANNDYFQAQTRANYDRVNRLREAYQAAMQAEATAEVWKNAQGR